MTPDAIRKICHSAEQIEEHLVWQFRPRGMTDSTWIYQIGFTPMDRKFRGKWFIEGRIHSLTDDETEVLRSLLPPAAIAQCMAAALRFDPEDMIPF